MLPQQVSVYYWDTWFKRCSSNCIPSLLMKWLNDEAQKLWSFPIGLFVMKKHRCSIKPHIKITHQVQVEPERVRDWRFEKKFLSHLYQQNLYFQTSCHSTMFSFHCLHSIFVCLWVIEPHMARCANMHYKFLLDMFRFAVESRWPK